MSFTIWVILNVFNFFYVIFIGFILRSWTLTKSIFYDFLRHNAEMFSKRLLNSVPSSDKRFQVHFTLPNIGDYG